MTEVGMVIVIWLMAIYFAMSIWDKWTKIQMRRTVMRKLKGKGD